MSEGVTPLTSARTRAGLTISELSRRSGVPTSTIWRIEHGKVTHPWFRTLKALAAELGVTTAYLMNGEGR